jgi:hypothetical protein
MLIRNIIEQRWTQHNVIVLPNPLNFIDFDSPTMANPHKGKLSYYGIHTSIYAGIGLEVFLI